MFGLSYVAYKVGVAVGPLREPPARDEHFTHAGEEPSERQMGPVPDARGGVARSPHLYERRHVLDDVGVFERNLRLGLFICCHF